ncbi:MAG: hypothetical protein PWR21_1138 [Methanoculleus sp.]|nr:hypothetical protein [Methanoculleus sp.]
MPMGPYIGHRLDRWIAKYRMQGLNGLVFPGSPDTLDRGDIATRGGVEGEDDVPQERSLTTVRWGGGSPPSKPSGFLMLAALALPFVPTP